MSKNNNWLQTWAMICDPGAVAKASAAIHAADRALQVEALRHEARKNQPQLGYQRSGPKRRRPSRRKHPRNPPRNRRGRSPCQIEVRRYKTR